MPYVELGTGTNLSRALYKSGTNTRSLIFEYVVVDGDQSMDLNYSGVGSLSGGTILDFSGNGAELDLPHLILKTRFLKGQT